MAGNWKLYKTPAETTAFFEKFTPLAGTASHCEVVICPTFTSLTAAVDAAKGSAIRVGAQNVAWAKEGAFTGEVSGAMIAATGIRRKMRTPADSLQKAGFAGVARSALRVEGRRCSSLNAAVFPLVSRRR